VIHSNLVDQWDWELVIDKKDRCLDFLESTVECIYNEIYNTANILEAAYPQYKNRLPEHITFWHSEDLLQRYPGISAKEREHRITKEYGAVFIIGIGGNLSDGTPHDSRATDYDDWSTFTINN